MSESTRSVTWFGFHTYGRCNSGMTTVTPSSVVRPVEQQMKTFRFLLINVRHMLFSSWCCRCGTRVSVQFAGFWKSSRLYLGLHLTSRRKRVAPAIENSTNGIALHSRARPVSTWCRLMLLYNGSSPSVTDCRNDSPRGDGPGREHFSCDSISLAAPPKSLLGSWYRHPSSLQGCCRALY